MSAFTSRFLILPMFIFWTDYAAHQGAANGPRDLALVGHHSRLRRRPRMRAHAGRPPLRPDPESGHPAAAHRGRAVRRIARREAAAAGSAVEAGDPARSGRTAGKPDPRLPGSGRCNCLWPRNRSVEVALSASRQPAAQRGMGQSLSGGPESYARLSARWRTHLAGLLLAHSGSPPPPRGGRSRSATPSPWC